MEFQIETNNNSRYQYLWILVMLTLTFPLVSHWPIFERQYVFLGISFILAIHLSKNFFLTPPFVWMVIYIVIVLLNFIGGDIYFASFEKVIYTEFFNFFIPSTITYYILKNQDYRLFRILILVFGLFLIQCTLISYIANSIYPGIMRLQSNTESIRFNASILIPFMNKGMSNYFLPHAIPVIIPALVFLIRKKITIYKKIFFSVLLIFSMVLTIVSESFTAMMFAIFSLIFSLLVNSSNINRTIIRLVISSVFLVPIATNKDIQLSLVDNIQSLFPTESIAYRKCNDIYSSILYDEADGSVSNRTETYEATKNAVLNNLVIGTNKDEIGGHSALFDRLAVLGLVGFIPLIMFLYYYNKSIYHQIKPSIRFYYYIGFIFALLMIVFKNMFCWSIWFFLLTLLPCMLIVYDEEQY